MVGFKGKRGRHDQTMARRPKVRILSPSDPRLQQPNEPPDLVPMFAVKGMIRGLLNHCWSPDRRSTKEGRIAQEELEEALVSLLEVGIKKSGITKESLPGLYGCLSYPEGFTDHYIQEIGRNVKEVFQMLTGHNPFILKADHDLLVEFTAQNYPPAENTEASRRQWLRDHLPSAFQLLKDTSKCSDCRDRPLFVLEDDTQMALHIKSPGELVHAILEHFHGISDATVKRLLSTPPPTP